MKMRDFKVIFSECDGYCEDLDRNGCISYPVTITWSLLGNVNGRPLVVILGEAREPNDMPPGELQVPSEILSRSETGWLRRPATQRQRNQGLLARGRAVGH